MTRAITVFLGVCLVLGSCTQRMICPAYQSAFIYDKDELRKKFSYFQEDSTPKILTASKNKYLVAEPTSYQRKIRNLQTVRMKPVPVHVPDSLVSEDSVSMEALDRAARSVIDSTFIQDVPQDTVATQEDSVYVITKDREVRLLKYNGPDSLDYDPVSQKYVPQVPKYYVDEVRYNLEQDHYMWYLRDAIVLPDVKLAKNQPSGEAQAGTNGKSAKKKKGLKGFFKNLFKKKPKAEPVDSAAVRPAVPSAEFDFVDEADTLSKADTPQQTETQPKKGLFGRKKKTKDNASKKNNNKKSEKAEVKPAEKKEEDDGF